MITVTVEKTNVRTDVLADELIAALGATQWSMAVDQGVVKVTLFDDAAAQAETVTAVITAHPTKAESSAEKTARRAHDAAAALSVQGFKAIRTDIQNAASLAALRPILLSMLRILYYLAAAQRLSQDDPS